MFITKVIVKTKIRTCRERWHRSLQFKFVTLKLFGSHPKEKQRVLEIISNVYSQSLEIFRTFFQNKGDIKKWRKLNQTKYSVQSFS